MCAGGRARSTGRNRLPSQSGDLPDDSGKSWRGLRGGISRSRPDGSGGQRALEFKGKPFVPAHCLSVPLRELVMYPDESLPRADGSSLDDDPTIHGDNTEALRALLPRYSSRA